MTKSRISNLLYETDCTPITLKCKINGLIKRFCIVKLLLELSLFFKSKCC